MQVMVKGLLYSSFSLQSRCIHTEHSGKLVLDWEFKGHDAVWMTIWQVLQFSGNGSFDYEADNKDVALVLVPPRPEEGLACSIFPEEALFCKAYFTESSDIDVQPS